jgi:hypothetical protein
LIEKKNGKAVVVGVLITAEVKIFLATSTGIVEAGINRGREPRPFADQKITKGVVENILLWKNWRCPEVIFANSNLLSITKLRRNGRTKVRSD